MTNIIIDHFPKEYEVYVEGFGGGASVLFQKEKTPLEVYNDLGENVYSLFKVLSDKEMFERLKERMDLTFYSEEIRQEFKNDLRGELSLEDRAYKYLFVNRSSFNGVGGFSTTMIVRRNMSKSCSDYLSMIDKLPEIHNRLSSVIIEHKDIMALLDKYDNEKTFKKPADLQVLIFYHGEGAVSIVVYSVFLQFIPFLAFFFSKKGREKMTLLRITSVILA